MALRRQKLRHERLGGDGGFCRVKNYPPAHRASRERLASSEMILAILF